MIRWSSSVVVSSLTSSVGCCYCEASKTSYQTKPLDLSLWIFVSTLSPLVELKIRIKGKKRRSASKYSIKLIKFFQRSNIISIAIIIENNNEKLIRKKKKQKKNKLWPAPLYNYAYTSDYDDREEDEKTGLRVQV